MPSDRKISWNISLKKYLIRTCNASWLCSAVGYDIKRGVHGRTNITCFSYICLSVSDEKIFSSPGPKARWAIAITWRPSSSSFVVRRKLFQRFFPLKLLDQLNQTWSESLLGCLVSKLCPVMPCNNQHGRCY